MLFKYFYFKIYKAGKYKGWGKILQCQVIISLGTDNEFIML